MASGAKILIIEDEPIMRKSIATYLGDSGYHMIQAEDGKKGFEMYQAEDPDLILLDLRMPGMDGLDVLSRVMTESPETPVIVVTGEGGMGDAVSALRLGAQDFITKPIMDMAILEHAAEKALEKARLLRENQEYREYLEEEVKKRTAALEMSQSRLLDIIALFDGFIYTCSEAFRLEFMNRKMKAHFGLDLTGEICYEKIHHRSSPCPWCAMASIQKGKTSRQEVQDPRDGKWYHIVSSPLIEDGGRVKNIQVITTDITAQKNREQDLRQNQAKLEKENLRLKSSMRGANSLGNIVGKSRAMQAVYEDILKAAESDASVIIYGESGTGKELVANTVHELSQRGGNRFVTVHCGAIPDNLAESEFFGYKKGAFTGADADKSGYLEVADKGTLFMDEIGELNLNMQVKLLRAMDKGGFTPVGGNQIKRPDLRIIAATNQDLKSAVVAGTFRRDFFYRIHIIPIHLPPLRERREDIPLLIHHFLQMFSDGKTINTIPDSMIENMISHYWTGNVRELQNAVQRYIAMEKMDLTDTPIQVNALEKTGQKMFGAPGETMNLDKALKTVEKELISRALELNRWHRTKTAWALGIDRRTLFRKMKVHGL